MNLFLYLLTVIIWGTTWLAIKLQLGVVAIPVSIFYRFALASLVLFAALLLTRKLQRLDRRGHWLCVGQGLCLFCLNFLCFYTATQWIPSGLVSVVFSAATLWNALNARLWFGTRIAPRVMVAGAFGFSGWCCCSGRNWPARRPATKPCSGWGSRSWGPSVFPPATCCRPCSSARASGP